MNPCECIFNQELAMRRLLELLRQSQDNCNDSECFDVANPGPSGAGMVDNSFMMYSMLWIVIGFLLYFLRPASLRNAKNNSPQFDNDRGDSAGPSHMTPPAQ